MSTIKATQVQREGATIVQAQVLDDKGRLVLEDSYEWPAGTGPETVARETKLLLQARLARQEAKAAPAAVAGLDGEGI